MSVQKYRLVAFLGLVMLLLAACAGAGQSGGQSSLPALNGTEWVLSSMNGQKPIEGSTVTIKFDAADYGGRSGCNSYGGNYTVEANGKLALGPGAMTEMACMEPAGVMEQEMAFLNTLSQAASYQVNNDQLEVKNAAGETILVFVKP